VRTRLKGTSSHTRLSTTRGAQIQTEKQVGRTITNNDYLSLHIWLLVGFEFIVAAHIV
jgi:hypothetical protein